MKISDYDLFVQETDQFSHLSLAERKEIAIYGLASEIGSVASAIKKKLLKEDRTSTWDAPTSEIVEELGDVMWYCFALARIANAPKLVNIFIHDIKNLTSELAAGDDRAEQIRGVIGALNRQAFLDAAESFRRSTREMTFNDYQSIAYLTARTEKRVLIEVCIAVLYQLSAEIFRVLLPDIERQLNKSLKDRPFNDILGEIAWHLSALASIYDLELGFIAQKNIEKVSYRQNRSQPVIVHDAEFPSGQRFPRHFEVAFVSYAKGKAQMYFEGERLGDTLTDNSYDDDGYRFHDVMHLANIAHLGWSPVVRSLMGRKRKANHEVDEIEDGARAKIVEEAVIKAIHSEGQRLAGPVYSPSGEPTPLFPDREDISFRFLKLIQSLVVGLEVSKNRFWEWENAIVEGYAIYHHLRKTGQGTVVVNLDERSLTYGPHVFIPLAGRVVGFGTAQCQVNGEPESSGSDVEQNDIARLNTKKRAILSSIGLDVNDPRSLEDLDVVERDDGEVGIHALGTVQAAMWEKKAVAFRVTALQVGAHWICNALALADD